jgi:protein-disulfide isomerase-like protein with CxxC motif
MIRKKNTKEHQGKSWENRKAEREYVQRQQHQQQERELMAKNLLMNGFPSFAGEDSVGTSYFHDAFAEIDSMLNGTKNTIHL